MAATHHQFGSIVGDADTGDGVFDVRDVILMREHSTVAVETLSQAEAIPVIALQMAGKINKSEDTVQAVWLVSLMDAGHLAAALLNAATRIGTPDALADFWAGFEPTS